MPFLDKILIKNPLLMRIKSSNHVVKFTLKLVSERLKIPTDREDFLGAFLKAKKEHPKVVNARQVTSYCVTNVFAGSDTTAISLRSVLYHLLKDDRTMKKVLDDINEVVGTRDCFVSPITFTEASKMIYLQAVLKEAMRMHPAVGLLLERRVPVEGCQIAGTRLPPGTTVGINPWVLHRNPDVWGEDVDIFRPERWLEADAGKLKLMERSFLAVRP